jgi:hypothetical protein
MERERITTLERRTTMAKKAATKKTAAKKASPKTTAPIDKADAATVEDWESEADALATTPGALKQLEEMADEDVPAFLRRKKAPEPKAEKKVDEPTEDWESVGKEVLKIEGLRFVKVYYHNTGVKGKNVGITESAPCLGWSNAYVIPGEKRSTIFCPYTFNAYQVPNDCAELETCEDAPHDGEFYRRTLTQKYRKFLGAGEALAFDVAALVMTRLQMPVPTDVVRPEPKPGDVAKAPRASSNGKPIIDEALKPIRPTGKRADVARRFLSEAPVSIRAVMAETGMTRSGVLSHLFCINRDHGLGYELGNDCARLVVPDGFVVFGEATVKKEKPAKAPKAKKQLEVVTLKAALAAQAQEQAAEEDWESEEPAKPAKKARAKAAPKKAKAK